MAEETKTAKKEPYAPRLKKPATFDHLRKKEPMERTVDIVLNDRVTKEVEEAQQALSSARFELASLPTVSDEMLDTERKRVESDRAKAEAKVTECEEALEAAREALAEDTVELRFRAIGRRAYDALLNEHPPTPAQEEEAKEAGNEIIYNEDTFPQALIAASCIEPQMTEEEVNVLWDEWNSTELGALFLAAMTVNTSRRVADLGNVFGGTRG